VIVIENGMIWLVAAWLWYQATSSVPGDDRMGWIFAAIVIACSLDTERRRR